MNGEISPATAAQTVFVVAALFFLAYLVLRSIGLKITSSVGGATGPETVEKQAMEREETKRKWAREDAAAK